MGGEGFALKTVAEDLDFLSVIVDSSIFTAFLDQQQTSSKVQTAETLESE